MPHLELWLEKYGERRAEILNNWQTTVGRVENLSSELRKELIFQEIKKKETIHQSMCFVDGGEGIRELMGLGVYFIKASAFLMPKDEKTPRDNFMRNLDMNFIEYNHCTKERIELMRDQLEFEIALQAIDEIEPDILFLDGSLYVKAFKKPIYCSEYAMYLEKYRELIKKCLERDICLVGISEDSKSRLFSKFLEARHGVTIPKYLTDSSVIEILSPYSSFHTVEFIPKNHHDNLFRNLAFPTTYVKTTPYSIPLRVDCLNKNSNLCEVASIISTLSIGSGAYGYPIPLYVAHLDAKVRPAQVEWTVNQLVSYVSKNNGGEYDQILRHSRRLSRPHIHLS
jgi:NurA-like 5'-3' nuclease